MPHALECYNHGYDVLTLAKFEHLHCVQCLTDTGMQPHMQSWVMCDDRSSTRDSADTFGPWLVTASHMQPAACMLHLANRLRVFFV